MNAKLELINHCGQREILCCEIHINCDRNLNGAWGEDEVDSGIRLTTGFTAEEWIEFLKLLDVEYDSGYGGQNLYGTIWYKDGTWSTRGEYDGSEWWEHHHLPSIPENLYRIDKLRDEKLNIIL